jgi:GDPmannose 4,6-dehydratase
MKYLSLFFMVGVFLANDIIDTLDNIKIKKNKDLSTKRALVFGITGQDGTYLTELLLNKGYHVYGAVRRTSLDNLKNLKHYFGEKLKQYSDKLTLVYCDVTDGVGVYKLIDKIKPHEVYNLAAQSHVKVSFEKPAYTCQVDALGTAHILESIYSAGLAKFTRFYQASTSELYGLVQEIPQSETTPFYPRSPYGVAKLYSFWITKNYRESYEMFACNGILFNHESPYRGDIFVTKVIARGVAAIKRGEIKTLELGNLDARRDWGHAKDYVKAMWLMLQQENPEDFVIATGETHTVREFATLAFKEAGIDIKWQGQGINEIGLNAENDEVLVQVNPRFFRPSEVELLLGNPKKAEKKLGWERIVGFKDLVKEMTNFELRN